MSKQINKMHKKGVGVGNEMKFYSLALRELWLTHTLRGIYTDKGDLRGDFYGVIFVQFFELLQDCGKKMFEIINALKCYE